MRVITTLYAALMLAACTQGNWDRGKTSYSFSFDSGPSALANGRVAAPLATPPAMFDGRGLLVQEAQGPAGGAN